MNEPSVGSKCCARLTGPLNDREQSSGTPAAARAAPSVPPLNLHGKEGIDGSSPSESLNNALQMGTQCCLKWRHGRFAGTRRVHLGTSGHSRARTSRDTTPIVLDARHSVPLVTRRAQRASQPCARMTGVDEGVIHVDFVRTGRADLADCLRDTVLVATGSCKRPLADIHCAAPWR
jgi:hypothetical protein